MTDDETRGDEVLEAPELSDDERRAADEQPLARVRYGLGKEILLYPDEFVALQNEVNDEIRIRLEHIRRVIMMPGEFTPSNSSSCWSSTTATPLSPPRA